MYRANRFYRIRALSHNLNVILPLEQNPQIFLR